MSQYYWTGNNTTSSKYAAGAELSVQKHPGKYYGVTKWDGGQIDFTGSNFGYGAMMISGSTFPADDYITLTGGGSIILNDMVSAFGSGSNHIMTPKMYDFSVKQISGSAKEAGVIYFFKTQV